MQFLKTQDAETIKMLLQTRVFPLYAMVVPSPYVLATSNWLLGKLSTCLPEVRFAETDCFKLELLFIIRMFDPCVFLPNISAIIFMVSYL